MLLRVLDNAFAVCLLAGLMAATPSFGMEGCAFLIYRQGGPIQGSEVDEFSFPMQTLEHLATHPKLSTHPQRLERLIFEKNSKAALLYDAQGNLIGLAAYRANKMAVHVTLVDAPGLETELAEWLKTRTDYLHPTIFVSVSENAASLQASLRSAGYKLHRVYRNYYKNSPHEQHRYVFAYETQHVGVALDGPLTGMKMYVIRSASPELEKIPREPLPLAKPTGTRIAVPGDPFTFEEALKDPRNELSIIASHKGIQGFILVARGEHSHRIEQIGARPGDDQREILTALIQSAMEEIVPYESPTTKLPVSLALSLYENDPRLGPICDDLGFSGSSGSVDRRIYRRLAGE